MSPDKILHIMCSVFLTLGCRAIKTNPIIPPLIIGTLVEANDADNNCPYEECMKDMLANIVGIGIGVLIIKTLFPINKK